MCVCGGGGGVLISGGLRYSFFEYLPRDGSFFFFFSSLFNSLRLGLLNWV